MIDIIEERIIIEMYHKKGESTNLELTQELEQQILKEGYRRVGTDFTLENGVKYYFSKEE